MKQKAWPRNLGISAAAHLLLFALASLLLPWRSQEVTQPLSMTVRFGQSNTAEAASGRPAAASQNPAQPQTQASATPRTATEQESTSEPVSAIPQAPQQEVAPRTSEVSAPATPAQPAVRPSSPNADSSPVSSPWGLEGLDSVETSDVVPGSDSRTSTFTLPGGTGELELQGTASGLRANPTQPYLRGFSNAYGQVDITFEVRDTTLRVKEIMFLSGTITALGSSESQRLREELRRWLSGWSLPGAKDGAQGRIRVSLVAPD